MTYWSHTIDYVSDRILPDKLKFVFEGQKIRTQRYESFRFKVVSFIRTEIFPTKTLSSNSNYLNLGCGRNIIKQFDNADTFVLRQSKVPFIGLDLTKKFPFESELYVGIFCEHTLEHLRFYDALNCLSESYRILKKGGCLRIVVPDLDLYLSNMIDSTINDEFTSRFATTAESISSLTQSWGHKSTWNFEILKEFLIYTGFREINLVSFKVGSDPDLLVDQPSRRWESLYVEAIT